MVEHRKENAMFRRSVFLLTLIVFLALVSEACAQKEEADNKAGSSRLPGEMQGVTDSEIRVGTLLPLSGNPAAAWGVAISQGMKAYYDYINDQGGIYGRKIKLTIADSQYTGPFGYEAARKLVEQEKVFAVQGTLGTEVENAVYKYLEERGIPDMYVLTGNSKWTDPVVPTRFCGLVDYVTEGRIFARYIKENYDGLKLGVLAQNDDYGKEGEKGVREGLREVGANMDVTVEYYEESITEVASQMQRLKAAGVGIVAFWGGPVQAANMIKTARETLNWDVPMMVNGTNALEIVGQLAGYDNIEGTISGMMGHQAWETNIPGIAERKAIFEKYAPQGTFDNTALVGYSVAEGMTGVLKQAGKDLTRESFIAAAESFCNYRSEVGLVPGSTSPTDHRVAQGDVLVKAVVDRSSGTAVFRWEPFGEVYRFESTTDCVVPTPPPDAENQPGPKLQSQLQTPQP
jgi:branched-chain amino acid transport system substrate-binding protein